MAGSSLRNALHRRNHKERGQLANRSRLGLLEKKKDYVQRARDYHSKQDRIRRLQEKAATRNKDEFYFSMINAQTHGGVHVQSRGNVPIPVDTVKILKSQDENYIRTMRAAGLKRITALKAELTTLVNLLSSSGDSEDMDIDDLDDGELKILRSANLLPTLDSSKSSRRSGNYDDDFRIRGSHVVFVEDARNAKSYRPRADAGAAQSQTQPDAEDEPVDLGWIIPEAAASTKKKREGKSSATTTSTSSPSDIAARERDTAAKSHRKELLKELAARLERDTSLRDALLEIKNQRLRMQNGSKRLIEEKSKSPTDAKHSKKKAESAGFTFNMNAGSDDEDGGQDDDEDEDGERGPNGELKWKPKVYKWKFERSR